MAEAAQAGEDLQVMRIAEEREKKKKEEVKREGASEEDKDSTAASFTSALKRVFRE